MSLLHLYDSWFPPIAGTENSILRPLVWVTTTFPLVVFLFLSVSSAGLLLPWPRNTWGALASVTLHFGSFLVSLWGYRKVVDYLQHDAVKVGVLTRVNVVVFPAIFIWLYYEMYYQDINAPIKWLQVTFIFFVSGIIVFVLGRIHRVSFLKEKSFSNANLTLLEKLISSLTGLAVPGWLMMHFRYFNENFYAWLFLLVLPVMLFVGLMPVFIDVIYIFTQSYVDWGYMFQNFKPPGIWGLISITYMSWGLVVYAMERNAMVRKIFMSLIFLSLSAFSIVTHFTEPEYVDASLGEAIFVNVGVIIMILLGCFIANEVVKKSRSPEINVSGIKFDNLKKTKPDKKI